MIALDIETAGVLPDEGDSTRYEVARDACEDGAPDRYLALSWPLARVVSVALVAGTREVVNLDARLLDAEVNSCVRLHDGEAALLEAVRTQLDALGARSAPLVTYNGARFDLPVLVARMVAHKIRPPAPILQALRQKPWESGVHVDLMSLFGHGNPRGVGSLRAWAVGLLGLDPKADGDGAHVGELIARRDGLALASYNLGDARVTAALYQRWMEVMS